MATIMEYARSATQSFADKPLTDVDALCFAWLSYFRLPTGLGVDNRAGVRIVDLCDEQLIPLMTAHLHDVDSSVALLRSMAASPRFANVRACLYVAQTDESTGMQFSATTFVLPDGAGSCIAFRGTDDTTLGWKENFRFACAKAIPAQKRARTYLQETVAELGGTIYVCGHSKGGALAAYACGTADADTRSQITRCYVFDGPGINKELKQDARWSDDVDVVKIVPHESLVGMLFERSQQALCVVRSTQVGVMQHAPFSWVVGEDGFVRERGVSYDAWRLSQRLNDWLDAMKPSQREEFAKLLAWLVDVTAEESFSSLLRRWSANREAMRAALQAGPQEDRELFERTMDDLVATVLLGSRQEIGVDRDETPTGTANAASRKLEDISAKTNDRLSRIDKLLGL